jgi:ribosomal protein L12E/L44/L45/RPP1/RPP2
MPETIAYAPIDYDAENIPPDAPAGAWQATATAKASKTSKDSFPMVIVDWELETAYDEENEAFVGARVSDFITFFPETRAGASKMSKVRLKAFCDKLGISRTLIPKHIASSDDLNDFIAAIDGQKADIWTVVEKSENKDTGEIVERTSVRYKAPGGVAAAGALPPVGGDDEEEEEEEPEEEEEEEEEEEVAQTSPKTGVRPTVAAAAAAKTNGKTANGKGATKGKAGGASARR